MSRLTSSARAELRLSLPDLHSVRAVQLASASRSSRTDTAALDAAADGAFPSCAVARCRLSLHGGELGGDTRDASQQRRAQLQASLVRFLRACPRGLLVVHDVHALPPAVLPALLPALSEAGQYTADGVPVPAWGATVILTAALPGFDDSWAASESLLARHAKASLQALLAAAAGGDEAAQNLAKAVRRRIDDVGPLRVAAAAAA